MQHNQNLVFLQHCKIQKSESQRLGILKSEPVANLKLFDQSRHSSLIFFRKRLQVCYHVPVHLRFNNSSEVQALGFKSYLLSRLLDTITKGLGLLNPIIYFEILHFNPSIVYGRKCKKSLGHNINFVIFFFYLELKFKNHLKLVPLF